jgi:ABC-type lipoprotein release transport system permease subunit
MAGTSGPADEYIASLRAEASNVSGLIRFVNVHPLQQYIDPQLRSWKLGALMFTLFGVSPSDPSTYAAVAAALALVAVFAGALPAWRASRVEPREALQAD